MEGATPELKTADTQKTLEEKVQRTLDEIRGEYNELCRRIGEFEYKKKAIEGTLPSLYQRLNQVDNENFSATVKPMAAETK